MRNQQTGRLLKQREMLPWIDARILGMLLYGLSGGLIGSGAVGAAQSALDTDGDPDASILVGLILLLPLPILASQRHRLGDRRTLLAFLAAMWVAVTYFQSFGGMTPGTVLALAALVVLAALFFGFRGLCMALVASTVATVLSALVALQGWARPWHFELWNPGRPLVWARYGAMLLIVGGSLAAALVAIMRGLREAALTVRSTLERERAERERSDALRGALEQARKMEALAQFAGGMAHDFNNNLAVILGAAEVLASDTTTPAHSLRLVKQIIAASEAGADTVGALLSLGREGNALAPQRVTLSALRKRCAGVLRGVFTKGIKSRVTEAPPGAVYVDAARLQQVILNLALNARDAMGDHGTFEISFEERVVEHAPVAWQASPGRYVVIACSDTGCGMDAATRTRIFEPFFTTKPLGKGTGLGLAMAHRLIHDSNGFIEVSSIVGLGTTFHLCLPYFPEE